MLIIPAIPRRRKRRREVSEPPVGVGPVLVGVAYVPGAFVTLTFDRDCIFDTINYEEFLLNDAIDTGTLYRGNSFNVMDARSVELELVGLGDSTGSARVLTAPTDNRVYDLPGNEWAGVTDVAIPFG